MTGRLKQLCLFVGALAFIGLSAFASQHVWRENGLKSLQAINEQRVQLVANAVKAEVGRQDHLPFVLSLDRDVRDALDAPDAVRLEALSRKLTRVSQRGRDPRTLCRRSGRHRAGRRRLAVSKYPGRAQRRGPPLFHRDDRKPAAAAISASSRKAIASAITWQRRSATRRLRGVAVVRIEFDPLEAAWERAGERVLVTDSDGIVFLASDPAYRYRPLGIGASARKADAAAISHYPGVLTSPIDVAVLERRGSRFHRPRRHAGRAKPIPLSDDGAAGISAGPSIASPISRRARGSARRRHHRRQPFRR